MALMTTADVEVVAAIASRCYNDLADADLGLQFLELLAKLGHENFIRVITDLMALNELRPHLLQAMRQPKRSQELMEAIGALFEKATQAATAGQNG
jgi:septum formation inhibitor-activating ATPase MinD